MFRQMTEKLLAVCLVTSVMIMAISGCAREEKVYKIGAVFALTGPASSLGIPDTQDDAVATRRYKWKLRTWFGAP